MAGGAVGGIRHGDRRRHHRSPRMPRRGPTPSWRPYPGLADAVAAGSALALDAPPRPSTGAVGAWAERRGDRRPPARSRPQHRRRRARPP
jgi:hypothetical protein